MPPPGEKEPGSRHLERLRVGSADEWEHFVSHSFYPLSLESAASGFGAEGTLVTLARGIRIAEMRAEASGLRRTRRLVAGSPSDDLLFLFQVAGEARIEQGDQQLVLRAGHATFCDPSTPYAGHATGRQEQIVTVVPRFEVLAPRAHTSSIRLQDISLAFAPLRVFRSLAEELASDPGMHDEAERSAVATVAAELIRSAATVAAAARTDPRSWSRETRLRAIREYMLARLSDSSLTMDRIAAVHGISVRHLTALFAPTNSPAAFLRGERLRRAHEDLISPSCTGLSVADIGARWGYPNATGFGRAYREAYKVSPSETRRLARQRERPRPAH